MASSERKVLEYTRLRPEVIHRAIVLMECGHYDRIEERGDHLDIPTEKHCLSCDAQGTSATPSKETFKKRRRFFDDIVEDQIERVASPSKEL